VRVSPPVVKANALQVPFVHITECCHSRGLLLWAYQGVTRDLTPGLDGEQNKRRTPFSAALLAIDHKPQQGLKLTCIIRALH
jgi:hypothetical protein